MITPKRIVPEIVEVSSPNKAFYTVNEYEFNDLRAQIAEANLDDHYSGWSVHFDGKVIPIDKHGRLDWPKGLFELYGDLLERILTAPIKNKK